jgi:NTP pyrophosphatase (non-canonical NTP hydrolase)
MSLNFKELQEQHKVWSAHNFGTDHELWEPIFGIMEELGELAHSILKRKQNIRGSYEQHTAKAIDAIADVTVFIAATCNVMGIDYQEVVESVWNDVKKRDFKKFPINGLTE